MMVYAYVVYVYRICIDNCMYICTCMYAYTCMCVYIYIYRHIISDCHGCYILLPWSGFKKGG